MSGGHFEYGQYQFNENIEQAEDAFTAACEDLRYNDEVLSEIQQGIILMRKAAIYMQRMDWLFSGDDGEDSFMDRLQEDLEEAGFR